jgi:hypothetical protein
MLYRQADTIRGMKSISAAIIVLAGAATFVAGAYHPHNDSKMVVGAIGLGLGLLGLIGWFISLRTRD